MEDQETLNGSCSYEHFYSLYYTVPTAQTLSDSFDSQAYLPFKQKIREKIVNVIRKNLSKDLNSFSSSIFDTPSIESIHEQKKQQDSSQIFLRSQYNTLKQKFIKLDSFKNKLRIEIEDYLVESCSDCELLRKDVKSTKEALSQALQLSKLLMEEVKKSGQFNMNGVKKIESFQLSIEFPLGFIQ